MAHKSCNQTVLQIELLRRLPDDAEFTIWKADSGWQGTLAFSGKEPIHKAGPTATIVIHRLLREFAKNTLKSTRRQLATA